MKLKVVSTGKYIEFTPKTLIIAGFTGKDRQAAEAHLREMAEHGIPVPDTIPTFYTADPSLVTTAPLIEVSTSESSGEVEPVLVTTGGKSYIAVGSDHTARDLEKVSIQESKRVCPKPISGELLDLDAFNASRETFTLKSSVGTIEGTIPYQDGHVSNLMKPAEILSKLHQAIDVDLEDSVVFLGTVPMLTRSFVYANSFAGELTDPASGLSIHCRYEVRVKEGKKK